MSHPIRRRMPAAAVLAASALAMSACAAGTAALEPVASHGADGHEDDAIAAEASAPTPRLAMTYDGGIVVIDANTLEIEADIPLEGFNRLNALGDERHLAVSTAGGFTVLDVGAWTQAHGDHAHYFTTTPSLTDLTIPAEVPGHVVVHDGLTTLFDDGTGDVTVLSADEWTHMVEEGHLDVIREYTTAEAHHGVGVATASGELLVTLGDEDSRDGAMILGDDGRAIAETHECPGVHGETAFTTAGGEELFMLGCDDGPIAFHGDHAHKFTAPDAYGRTGNLFSIDGSDVVLGDYKSDPEAGIGLSEIALIDAEAETLAVIDPFGGADAQYTWRGLARGEGGEALVLGTDGALRVLDPSTGEIVRSVQVVDAWDVPDAWQSPHPALTVLAGMAYVTEPATGEIHVVDYVGGEVWKSADVGVEMNEIAGIEG
ncbi:hypothetical protein [Demequina sp. NBRC 110052]|uniref:hypothetical protein n=1 Tax=Demequina sp. NBRC 110052 TaxID=1570341 RepID=UPI000A022A26|nr:hypothetical protein [Demequina sp. NBRC 110052]